MDNNIIVYRNPIEKWFWESLSNNSVITWGLMILLVIIVVAFFGYIINATLGEWIRNKRSAKRLRKYRGF